MDFRFRGHIDSSLDCGEYNCSCETAVNIVGIDDGYTYFDNEKITVARIWYNTNKVGGANQWSTKHLNYVTASVTKLNTCDICGKTSTPKKVNYRADACSWNVGVKDRRNSYLYEDKSVLCMSCWNKIKPIVKKDDEYLDIKQLITKLEKEIAKWRKSQKQANLESIYAQQ